MSRLDPQIQEVIESAMREGIGDREIERRTGVHRDTIGRHRRQMGLPAPPRGVRGGAGPAAREERPEPQAAAPDEPTIRIVCDLEGVPVEVWLDGLCVPPALLEKIAARLDAITAAVGQVR